MSQKEKPTGGIGFVGLLTIVFITLKLCHVINWSWWFVLLPTLLPFGLIALVLIFAILLKSVIMFMDRN